MYRLGVIKTAKLRKAKYVVSMREIRNAYETSEGKTKGKRRNTIIRQRTVRSKQVAQDIGTVLRAVQSANMLINLFPNSFLPWEEWSKSSIDIELGVNTAITVT
jgi:hypothetical protein